MISSVSNHRATVLNAIAITFVLAVISGYLPLKVPALQTELAGFIANGSLAK
jgi:hypothetical protein